LLKLKGSLKGRTGFEPVSFQSDCGLFYPFELPAIGTLPRADGQIFIPNHLSFKKNRNDFLL
jgi:hypothetical protein